MSHLYIIATPIGNREDISARALRVLSEVDTVVAEDTRVAGKLLHAIGIKKDLISLHHHTKGHTWDTLATLLSSGKDLAYVTDAGTPGISDPGGKLVAWVTKEHPDVIVTPLPGPSALTAALSIAGIPLDEFLFLGFLPHKKGRMTKLKRAVESDIPVILFESVHRIQKLVSELAEYQKQVIVCRELTKTFETIYRGTTAEISIPESETKGEFVVILHDHE